MGAYLVSSYYVLYILVYVFELNNNYDHISYRINTYYIVGITIFI